MKKYLQLTILLSLVGIFAGQELLAQSKPFYNRWTFTKVNDLPTRFKVYTSIQTKDSDVGGRGRSFLYDGAPSLATINNDIYRQAGVNANPFASHIGEFFLTYASFKPMPFILDYGFDDTDGDNRYHFEKTTWAYGDYLEDESPEIILAKNDEVYDCNFVKQDCRVYQRHYFNVPRNKIHENPDKGFTRSLIIRYYQGGKVAKTMIIPITVLGGFTQRESIGPGPLELKFVLRAPPGDASFSYIEKGQENSSEVVASATQSSSKTKTTTIKSEVGFEKSGFGGSASSTLEMKTSTTRERGETNQTKFTVTTEDRIENKTGSDMFLFERNQYFYDKDFSVKAFFTNSGKVQMELQSKIVLRYVKKLQDVYVYENKIRSDSIPLYTATNQPKKAKFWQDVLALNKRAKENPVNIRPAQININNKEGRYIRENASAFTLSESLAITKGISFEVEGGISTPVSSVSVSQKTEYEFTTTNSTDKTQAAASRFTVGYYVEDTSPGDVINMQIADDPVFGMPIFKLASTSRTSCPFQPGTIQRDRPLITVENPKKADEFLDSAKYSDIESGKEVAFLVKVKNNSDSKETRIYRLRKFGERLPSMEYDQDEFALEYGQEKEFDVYVRNRRDIDVGYDNIFLVVEPRCNIAYYDGEGRFDDGYISDTIKLAAYWGATDKDRAPDNNDIETALLIPSDGRLVSTYKNIFGSDSKVSNRNATTFAGEQSLVPPTECQKGWCAETADGKPEITNSVWFKFVVNSLDASISTCDPMNNGFNSQMAVFKIRNIADPASYVRLGANDKDFCRGNDNSTITLNNLTLGDTLYILIDGNKAAQADFGISVTSLPPLGDDECSEIRLTISGKSSGRYSNISGTVSERENDLVANIPNDYFSGWKNDSIQHSAWFRFVAPDGGEVIIDVLNATFDTQMAVFEAAACGVPEYFSQWTFMGANDDITSLGGLNSQLFLKGLEKGKPYKILVDGHNGAMGFFDMKLTIPTPANDEPINAIALQIDAAGQGVFSNGGATSPDAEQVIAPPVVELNKPGGWSDKENDPRARRIERSVWFKFVAPSEGAVKISTCDQENFFVQLAAYKVGNLLDYSTFELIGADDESQFCRRPPSNESPNGRNIRGSIIELTGLTPDSTYYLVVDGSVNSFGQFSIDLLTTPSDPPINDEACKAIELAVDGEVKKGFHNLSASVTDTEEKITPPEWLDGDMQHTVWFTFKAPESQEVEISLCDLANFDTQIAVYEVEDCKLDTNFVLVAANEDGPKNCSTGGDSFLPIKGLTAGKTYYIVVDGYGNNQGIFSILLKDKITPGPANDDVVNAILIPVDGKVKSGFSNSFATVRDKEQDIRPKPAANQPDCVTGWCDNQVDNSVWFKFVAPADGKVKISTCDLADFDTQLALFEVSDVNDFSTFKLIAANDAGPADCSTFFDSFLPVEGLTAGKTYYVLVDGFDGDNGAFSISLTGDVDTQAPSTPTNLTAANIETTSIDITWAASTDDRAVKEYLVYVNGTAVATVTGTSYSVKNLTSETTYSITVVAKDDAGNSSSASTALSVTTTKAVDTQAPTSPTGLTATDTQKTTIGISWTASTDNVKVKEYRIYVDGKLTATATTTTFSITGLTAGTAYSIYVVAVDDAGNASEASTALKVTTLAEVVADTSAPSAATNLTASEITTTSLKVSWNPATDNLGVTEYQIFVDGNQKTTTAATSVTLTGLTKATAYSIYITAKDAAGNVSAASAALKVTTSNVEIVGIEPDLNNQYLVYPNPFTSRIVLEYPGNQLKKGDITVYNLEGQHLLTPDFKIREANKIEVDLESLVSGTHIILIKQDTKTVFKKVIKQQ